MKKETQRDLSKQIESLRSLRSNALEEKDTVELRFISQIEELCKKVDTFEDIGNTFEIKEKNIKELQRDSQEQDDIIVALITEVKKYVIHSNEHQELIRLLILKTQCVRKSNKRLIQ